MRALGEAKELLALPTSQARPEHKEGLNQSRYVTTIPDLLQMAGSRLEGTPTESITVLQSEMDENHVAINKYSQAT